jgi:uncharacterized protein (UPF0335 family)
MVQGNVKREMAPIIEKVQKEAKSIMQGINPKTVQIALTARLGVGEDYEVIKEVVDIWKQEETTIQHK